MDAQYLEHYDKLCELKPGDIAVSKDRKKLFLCTWVNTKLHNITVVIDLNNPTDQYSYSWDFNQPVKRLEHKDKFVITV